MDASVRTIRCVANHANPQDPNGVSGQLVGGRFPAPVAKTPWITDLVNVSSEECSHNRLFTRCGA